MNHLFLTNICIMYLPDVYCCKKNIEEASLLQLQRRTERFISSDNFRFVMSVQPALTQSALKDLFWNQMNF
jgi:hypothetical protein